MKETQYQKYLKQIERSQTLAFVCNFVAGFIAFGVVALLTYYKYFNK
jgi:hypothetical protein